MSLVAISSAVGFGLVLPPAPRGEVVGLNRRAALGLAAASAFGGLPALAEPEPQLSSLSLAQVSALLGSKTLSEYLSELEEENGQPASPGVISAKEAAEARRKAAEEKAAKERAELDAVIAARRAEREERVANFKAKKEAQEAERIAAREAAVREAAAARAPAPAPEPPAPIPVPPSPPPPPPPPTRAQPKPAPAPPPVPPPALEKDSIFGFKGSDLVKSGTGAKPLDVNALPSIPSLPSFNMPKMPEAPSPSPPVKMSPDLDAAISEAREARNKRLGKESPAPATKSTAAPVSGPVCAPKERGCVQSTKVKGADVLPAWAYPSKLKGADAGRFLKRALEQCGATSVMESKASGGVLRVSAKFSTGLFGLTTDVLDFEINPSLGAVAFRAVAPGDAGRARSRLSRVRARLNTGSSGKWKEIS